MLANSPANLIAEKSAELEGTLNHNTYYAYRRIWAAFSEALEKDYVESFSDLSKAHVVKFLVAFRGSPSSYNQAKSATVCILQELASSNVQIPHLQAIKDDIKRAKKAPVDKLFLTQKQLQEARENIYTLNASDRVVRERNLLIYDLLCHSLMRVDELVSLQLMDIDMREAKMWVRGKGAMTNHAGVKARSRFIPLKPVLLKSIDDYVTNWRYTAQGERYKPYLNAADTLEAGMPMFTSKRNKAVDISTVKKFITQVVASVFKNKNIPVPRNHGPHCIRRTRAKIVYSRDKNLVLVQAMLGHQNIETTMNYLDVGADEYAQGFLHEG
ncbi:MAG: site-specific integrase [Mariprofundaceae bacterium]